VKALVTGITGFVGSHMAEYLLDRRIDVVGTVRPRSRMDHISAIAEQLDLVECELRDPYSVEKLIREKKPDLIFHLAAQSHVPTSWNSPIDTIVNNVAGQVNILEAIARYRPGGKVLIACSGEEYGQVEPEELPVKETAPLRPISPYAVSKAAQDLLGYQYFASRHLHIVRTRTFNHTGPRRGEHFATSNFAKQIAEIELGLKKPVIDVGNLDARRDFTDVRDVVRAYDLALARGEPGEVYNIAAGRVWSLREVLDLLLAMTTCRIEVRPDPARLRPVDVDVLVGDAAKFRRLTGWRPEIPLERTLGDLLDYWRNQLRRRR
jgi:GDP-4-dehydro-6-deoxy-D-mannose reductase